MGRLPGLLAAGRGRIFALVVGAGVTQAAAAAGAALLTPRVITTADPRERLVVAAALVASAVVLGLARWAERVLAERLGQEYVHGVRLDLVTAALSGRGRSSLGVTVARTTNDLTAIRTWIVQGVAPLATGTAMVLGVLIGLALLHPVFVAAGIVPLVLLLAGLGALAPAAYRRARELRRRRGRMASHLADTVTAGRGIRRAGGIEREVSGIADRSSLVVDRAVSRSVVTGAMRGLAAGTAALAAVVAALAGSSAGVDAATIASALMLVGMLTVPLSDLGRIVEFRQGFLAAEWIIAPHLDRARRHREEERRRSQSRRRRGEEHPGRHVLPGVVHVADLDLGGGPTELFARPGERVVFTTTDPDHLGALVGALVGDPEAPSAWINVAGHRVGDLPARDRRALVGYAGADVALERGTLARAVRYRVPGSDAPVLPLLREVGLAERVERLPRGERTRLTAGGEPLTLQERARVHVARALYERPPLLVLDRVDAALGVGGRAMLRERLADYPGVVLVVSDDPDGIVPGARRVDLDVPRSDRRPEPPASPRIRTGGSR